MHKEKIYNDLSQLIDENKILKDEPMKNYTTFKIGGNADFLINATEKKDIISVYKYAIKNNCTNKINQFTMGYKKYGLTARKIW